MVVVVVERDATRLAPRTFAVFGRWAAAAAFVVFAVFPVVDAKGAAASSSTA